MTNRIHPGQLATLWVGAAILAGLAIWYRSSTIRTDAEDRALLEDAISEQRDSVQANRLHIKAYQDSADSAIKIWEEGKRLHISKMELQFWEDEMQHHATMRDLLKNRLTLDSMSLRSYETRGRAQAQQKAERHGLVRQGVFVFVVVSLLALLIVTWRWFGHNAVPPTDTSV